MENYASSIYEKGIPDKILELLEDLYSATLSCVRVDGELSPWLRCLQESVRAVF